MDIAHESPAVVAEYAKVRASVYVLVPLGVCARQCVPLMPACLGQSGRASCRVCKQQISQDTLRLGHMVQSPHFDGKIPMVRAERQGGAAESVSACACVCARVRVCAPLSVFLSLSL
jgi:hypothetical protein